MTEPADFAQPSVEGWVTVQELALVLGVSVSTIKRWLREDPPIPSETWGMKRTRRYLPSECIAWARGRDGRRT
jgi:hypothetical protein